MTEDERLAWATVLRPMVQRLKGERGLSERRLASEVDLSPPAVGDFLKESGTPQETTLRKLQSWVDQFSENGDGNRTPAWPTPVGEDRRADRILEFFGSPTEGFRRMARNLPLRDFAKAALRTAIDDEWSEGEFQALYEEVKDLVHEGDAG